jgi:hypothetical protein
MGFLVVGEAENPPGVVVGVFIANEGKGSHKFVEDQRPDMVPE